MLIKLIQVQPIVDDVRCRGDVAVKEFVILFYSCLFYYTLLPKLGSEIISV